jgi:predicted RNA binding protein YcfA (HicA-like mRNA interferase family)
MRDESSREIITKLKKDGWKLDRVKGSHHQFVHPTKPGTVTVQHPVKTIFGDVLRNIYRQAGWKW